MENPPEKQGFLVLAEPLKSLGKEGKTLKIARKIPRKARKQGNPKKNKEKKIWEIAAGPFLPLSCRSIRDNLRDN